MGGSQRHGGVLLCDVTYQLNMDIYTEKKTLIPLLENDGCYKGIWVPVIDMANAGSKGCWSHRSGWTGMHIQSKCRLSPNREDGQCGGRQVGGW